MKAPLLVLGVGNPSRGDDALGPLFIERLEQALEREVSRGDVELLTDFQLQIEHALDLAGRDRVVFVDASVRAAPPFEYARVEPRLDATHSTHALSPEAVLATHRSVLGEPPESWVLAIRGERFELGDPLSDSAQSHLEAALSFFVSQARGRRAEQGGRRLEIEGTVQGVGFRPWVYRTARALGLGGSVRNTARGVTVDVFGAEPALDALLRALQTDAPPAARVRAVRVQALPSREPAEMVILASAAPGAAALSLPPDLASCDDCLREVADAKDRHNGYAFTSCMHCGPRLSIARALPYDRATTSMSAFAPCPACAAEYCSPEERRFHAQTLACPACGPRLWLADPAGAELASDEPIRAAAARVRAGELLAVQGLGAFHLCCDATNAAAVAELRRRKRRDAQPFAVMVRDAAAAEALAELDGEALTALTGSARPIVLCPSRPGALPDAVNGPSRRTGVLLPYTPLHQRLVELAARPLVVTSGNPSGGPAVIEHAAAFAALAGIADAFLLHDREIVRRVEDSVVAAGARGLRVLRRARGLAPAPLRLPAKSPEPVLALGGHMKNTACLVVDDLAYLTPHLGDLGHEQNDAAWQRDVEGFERLLGVRAEVLAYDLHPDYGSTRYALERPARRRVGVQHHVAHVLAAVAELRVEEPVLGVAFDGTGFGLDGTLWGAELLLVDGARWTRLASFRPLPLPGGERALREVWRVALAALHEGFGPSEARALTRRLGLFASVPEASIAGVLRLLETGVSCVPARGMGRWFDAAGALALGLPRAEFEGHVAVALEEAGGDLPEQQAPAYPAALPSAFATEGPLGHEHEVDLRPTLRALAVDLLEGASPARISARFHRTVSEATAAVIARALGTTGLRRVVLTGGSFQNRRLEQGVRERLGTGRVAMAREAPINDGGLSLGQAWAAVLALGERPS